MKKEITGKVISVKKQMWFKVNSKPLRTVGADGALFPHIIKVEYSVNGKLFKKSKWIPATSYVPSAGESVRIVYDENSPRRAKIL